MKLIELVAVMMSGEHVATLYSLDAYKELRLQFSTGDFHTHKHEVVSANENVTYFEFDTELNEFVTINEEI